MPNFGLQNPLKEIGKTEARLFEGVVMFVV